MSYWLNQPLEITDKFQIYTKPKSTKYILPKNFKIITLGSEYFQEITKLINDNYVEDSDNIIRINYSEEMIYWYLKDIPSNYILGLLYKNILVGFICAKLMNLIIYGENHIVPYINLLCIQKKIQNIGLCIYLIEEIKNRLLDSKINLELAYFTSVAKLGEISKKNLYFCKTNTITIPINYSKLKSMGLIEQSFNEIPSPDENILHPIKKTDIPLITKKLNKYLENFTIKNNFTDSTTDYFFYPKKNIIYSFVIRNKDGIVTDFVSVYKYNIFCIEQKINIYVAQLTFYFNDSISLTGLIYYLIDKLRNLEIDQLTIRNQANTSTINLDKYEMDDSLHHYLFNCKIPQNKEQDMFLMPI